MGDHEEFENRFAHLLQPIRDLQKNWDIDLSHLLEDYLQELGNINVDLILPPPTFRSQPTASQNTQQRNFMNFAEAALLIQGSTHVYGKKVEYVYALAFKLLELLSKKNSKFNANQTSADDGDDVAANNSASGRRNKQLGRDDDEPFLSLDDIQVNGNIDLNQSLEIGTKSNKAPKLIVPMPFTLVPLEDFEKSEVPLIAKNGEVIGKKDDYRVNTCFLHESGTLLLGLSGERFINDTNGDLVGDRRVVPEIHIADTSNADIPGLSVTIADDVTGIPMLTSPEKGDACAPGVSPELPIEGASVMHDADDFEPLETPVQPFKLPNNVGAVDANNITGKIQRQVRGREKDDILDVNSEDKRRQMVLEAWTNLNEFEDISKAVEKPIRKGRTYKIPELLKNRKRKLEEDTLNKTDARTNSEEVDLPKESLAEFFKNVVYNKRLKFPKNPLKVPEFGELDDLFWEEQKRRRLRRMKNAKLADVKKQSVDDFTAVKDFNLQNEDVVAEEGGINESQIDRNLLAIFEGPDDDGGAFNEGDDDVDAGMLTLNDDDFRPPTLDVPISQGSVQNNSTMTFDTYEEYVQYRVEKYLKNAQKSVAVSALCRRVQDWEEKIAPLLHLEETHRSFDIHKYGDEILNFFNERKCVEFLFREFSITKEQWEVCRYFLAVLMLANQGNVEISQQVILDESLNTMKLKFLKAERHHVQFDDYLAPSVSNQ